MRDQPSPDEPGILAHGGRRPAGRVNLIGAVGVCAATKPPAICICIGGAAGCRVGENLEQAARGDASPLADGGRGVERGGRGSCGPHVSYDAP